MNGKNAKQVSTKLQAQADPHFLSRGKVMFKLEQLGGAQKSEGGILIPSLGMSTKEALTVAVEQACARALHNFPITKLELWVEGA